MKTIFNRSKLVKIPLKVSVLILSLFLLAGSAFGATYYKRGNGTAANKAAATGPCTDLSACMNRTVYAGETFSDGDVIVSCHSLIEDGLDEVFLNISRTLSIPSGAPDRALKASDGYIKTSTGGYIITQ